MKYSVRITDSAETDLNSAVDYIEFNLLNPQAADNLLDCVEGVFKKLSDAPQIHALVDDPVLNAWGIRFVTVNNYMAFYRIDERFKIVYIVRFLYGKRNWIDILKNMPSSMDE
jgi:plasmid stabilization system protein ParE